jgi:preprotein translocase SecE subunit
MRDERQSKPVRRETKAAPASAKKPGGFANRPTVRFVREAYRELRYKVTWPTFLEARNMTIAVILLSLVVGLVLGLVDAGLFQLFQLITGK